MRVYCVSRILKYYNFYFWLNTLNSLIAKNRSLNSFVSSNFIKQNYTIHPSILITLTTARSETYAFKFVILFWPYVMQKYGNEEVFTFRKSLSFVCILDEEVYICI